MKKYLRSRTMIWECLRHLQLRYFLWLTRKRIKHFDFSDDEIKDLFDRVLEEISRHALIRDTVELQRIEARREAFLHSKMLLQTTDKKHDPYCDNIKLCEAASASKLPELAAVLYLLIQWRRPETVVEFGTNIGISAAWQATALKETPNAELHTVEISPARIQFAEKWLAEEGFTNIHFHNMDFDQSIQKIIPTLNEVDYAFIDGNHNLEATLRYFEQLKQVASKGAVFVFDDIRWSDGMRAAWSRIQVSGDYRCSLEFAGMGIVILAD